MGFDIELAGRIMPTLLNGAFVTLSVFVPCIVFGMVISVPIALARLSSNTAVAHLSWAFSMFFRGVPALVLLYMIYNGFATVGFIRDTVLWNMFSEAYFCAVVGFTLNHSGFLVELLRGAFQAVPKGVLDAADALALPRHLVFIRVTFPLAIRYGLSNYMNEVILFLKGTAAIGAITMMDLLASANTAVSTTYDPFTPLVGAAFIYWFMVQIIRIGFGRLETHLNRHLELLQ
jgi:His/Glu/Gln/Arg/opine family amino acid ABC transporter permease subunit